jgi:hypothetical protein
MQEIEQLLNATLPFIESLLRKYGEFYPVTSAVNTFGKIVQMGTHNGNERPNSQDVINDLRKSLIQGVKKGEYKALTIFYDVKVVNPHTNIKTDAIAVIAESKTDSIGYRFYYPYTLTLDRQLNLSKSWGSKAHREIFSN